MDAALPVDQGAVAVEGQNFEVPQSGLTVAGNGFLGRVGHG
jgi:hypothetical protein